MTELNKAVDKVINTNPIIIKRYANRKLYNTNSHDYITLDQLEIIMANNTIKVIDNKTNKDITNLTIGRIIANKIDNKPQLNRNILDYVNTILEGV